MRVYFRVASLNILGSSMARKACINVFFFFFSWLGVDFNVLLTAVRFTSERTNCHNDDIKLLFLFFSFL